MVCMVPEPCTMHRGGHPRRRHALSPAAASSMIVENALDSIEDDEKPNSSALSCGFVVPYHLLRQRYRG